MKKFRFYIKNFGCKVNQYDGQVLGVSISYMGEEVSGPSGADVVIVNTCGVTKGALSSGLKYVRRIKTRYPEKEVLAVGCAVGKNENIFRREGAEAIYGFKGLQKPDGKLKEFKKHTRGFIKIQQGCRGSCVYCSVKEIKKPFYVKPPRRVIEEILLMSVKHPEIVICGTNLNFYHDDCAISLMGELIEKIKNIKSGFRWRFSSIPPSCLSDENLNLLKGDEKFCRHFHIPIQSGSNKILKKMGRPYDLNFLEERIQKSMKILENPSFSYDIIVGFDGETEKDFCGTLRFLKKYPPVRVHLFRYSRVISQSWTGKKISEKIKRERMERVREISDSLILKQMRKAIGTVKEVIPENNSSGYTRDYIPVKIGPQPYGSRPVKLLITSVCNGKLKGTVKNH